jgi:threonine synthase
VSGDTPRFVCVQEEGCTPLVSALRGEAEGAGAPVRTAPTGLRVPAPPDGALVAGIVRESGGTALAVTRDEIASAQAGLGALGISSSPEGAATLAALRRLADTRWVGPRDRVVLFNTAGAMKYRPWTPPVAPRVVSTYAEYRDPAAAPPRPAVRAERIAPVAG